MTSQDFGIYIRWPRSEKVKFYSFSDDFQNLQCIIKPFKGKGIVRQVEAVHVFSKKDIETFDKVTAFGNSKTETNTSKMDFEKSVEYALDSIKSSTLEKVVLSRVKSFPHNYENIFHLYGQLLDKYADYSYLLIDKELGIWMGSSPELLLKTEGLEVNTTALAGTRTMHNKVAWTQKEYDEQAIVSKYIVDTLKQEGGSNIRLENVREQKSGSLIHLASNISARFKTEKNMIELAYRMHPTPALGGFPRETAMTFIGQQEKHSRSLYGGFIGIKDTKCQHYFVNIRCMKLNQFEAKLYTGAGINSGSNASLEWEETEAKMKVMSSLLT